MSNSILKFLKYSNFDIKKAIIYKRAYDMILEQDLFDEGFYSKFSSNCDDLLSDYLFNGYKNGFSPSLDFNGEKYLEDYPNVKKSGMNPLVHYVLYGKDEGKKIFPLPDKEKIRILEKNKEFLHDYEFKEGPLVSIIVLNRNGEDLLKVLFKDFKATTNYDNFELIVVDNASSDGSLDYLKSLNTDFPLRIIENDENQSFSKANNDAVKTAEGEYVLLLNNDMEPTYGWLNEMMGVMLNNDNVGSVGAKLIFPFYSYENEKSFKIQHASDMFTNNKKDVIVPYNQYKPLDPFFHKANFTRKCISVTGACLLVKKSVYEELGGLDEGYFYGYEDVDFSLKLYEAGYDVYYCSSALLFHHESFTRKNAPYLQDNHNRLINKWYDLLSKGMFLDKMNHDNFFTERTLKFALVYDKENTASEFHEKIKDLADFLIGENYIVELFDNLKKHNIAALADVFVSFSKDYDIDRIDARGNIIKVLFLDGSLYESHDSLDEKNKSAYDLLCADKDLNDQDMKYIDSNKTFLHVLEDIVLNKYD